MTYECRLPANYSFGVLTSAAAISDTTLTSTDFATGLASGLSTTTYVPITLQDPSTKNFEIVWANAHTGGANTATVLRAKEGSTARAWGAGTLWTVSPTLRDGVLPVANVGALPSDAHVGCKCLLLDEQQVLERIVGAWVGMPRGLVGYGWRADSSTPGANDTTGDPVLRLDNVPLQKSRAYRIYTNDIFLASTVDTDIIGAALTYTTSGTPAVVGSPPLPGADYSDKDATAPYHIRAVIQAVYVAPADQQLSVLLKTLRYNGSGFVTTFGSANAITALHVEDIGRAIPDTGTDL